MLVSSSVAVVMLSSEDESTSDTICVSGVMGGGEAGEDVRGEGGDRLSEVSSTGASGELHRWGGGVRGVRGEGVRGEGVQWTSCIGGRLLLQRLGGGVVGEGVRG